MAPRDHSWRANNVEVVYAHNGLLCLRATVLAAPAHPQYRLWRNANDAGRIPFLQEYAIYLSKNERENRFGRIRIRPAFLEYGLYGINRRCAAAIM
jgi:hypothetical protein